MAEVNPRLNPVQAEDYTNRSRGVSVPDNIKPTGQATNDIMPRGVAEGNRAAEYAGKAAALEAQREGQDYEDYGKIANVIDKSLNFSINTTDSLIKKQIEREVYNQVNQEREGYITELQGIKDKLSGPGPKLQSFLDANASAEELPEEIQEFTQTADRLEAARLQGAGTGKMKSVDYAAKIHGIAKDLRNRYQGHAEYVDQQMERVTGQKSGNFMYTQLLGDINARLGSQDAMTKRAMSLLEKYPNIPGAAQMYQDVVSGGKNVIDVMRFVAPYEQRRMRSEMIKLDREDVENSQKTRTLLATKEVDNRVATMSGEAVQNFQINILGANSKEGFLDFVSKAGAGVYNNQQLQAAGQQLIAQIPIIEAHMMAQGRVRGANGRTLIQDSGGMEAYRKKVSDAMQEYKTYADTFYSGSYGFTGNLARSLQGKMDQSTDDMVSDPDIAPELLVMNSVRRLGGESNLNETYLNFFKKGWDKRVEKYTSNYAAEFRAQTKMEKTGLPTTVKDAAENGKRNGTLTNQNALALVQDTVDSLLKSNVPDAIKYNLAQAMFADGNLGFVESLNKDGVDAKGRPILGTFYTYNMMTSPEVAQQMHALGKVKPEIWKNYVNWSTTTFRNLFVREMRDLEAASTSKDITIHWLNKEKRFFVKETGYTDTSDPANKYARNAILQTKSQVQKLNDGLNSIKEIAAAAGKDDAAIESYLLDTMGKAGWKPTEGIKDLPSKFMQELVRARMIEESLKKERSKVEGR